MVISLRSSIHNNNDNDHRLIFRSTDRSLITRIVRKDGQNLSQKLNLTTRLSRNTTSTSCAEFRQQRHLAKAGLVKLYNWMGHVDVISNKIIIITVVFNIQTDKPQYRYKYRLIGPQVSTGVEYYNCKTTW